MMLHGKYLLGPEHCFLSSLVEIGLVVLKKIIFKHFPIYYYVTV